MAIGISYTGHDGRRRDFTAEGNPEPGSDLDRIVRGADAGAGEVRRVMTPLADAMRRARRPQGPDPRIDRAAGTVKLDPADHRPGTLADKIDAGGSIEASRSGVRLKGDEEPKTDGLYAKKGGRRGFFSLDEIDDPNAKGGIVGEQDAANRFAVSNKESGGDGAFSENMQSRTEAEVNEETGEVTFWEYTKRWDVTNGRRVGGVSGETKRKICSFFLGGDGDRQITYTGDSAPFTVARSHYTDENGKLQYEYWVKCLKWGIHQKGAGYSVSGMGVGAARGAYAFGNYGHYPKRPAGRPRKLVFDSGREALVDIFEETSLAPNYNDGFTNCWTYIGSSAEFPSGSFKLYGYYFSYYVPYKTNHVDETRSKLYFLFDPYVSRGDGTYQRTDDNWERVDSEYWNYSFEAVSAMVVTTEPYDKAGLLRFLASHGALVASAHTNDDFDKGFHTVKILHGGELVVENILPFYPYWDDSSYTNTTYPSLATWQKKNQQPELSDFISLYGFGRYGNNHEAYETQQFSYPQYTGNWVDMFPFSKSNGNSGDGMVAEIVDCEIFNVNVRQGRDGYEYGYDNYFYIVNEGIDGEIIIKEDRSYYGMLNYVSDIVPKRFGNIAQIGQKSVVVKADRVCVNEKIG